MPKPLYFRNDGVLAYDEDTGMYYDATDHSDQDEVEQARVCVTLIRVTHPDFAPSEIKSNIRAARVAIDEGTGTVEGLARAQFFRSLWANRTRLREHPDLATYVGSFESGAEWLWSPDR